MLIIRSVVFAVVLLLLLLWVAVTLTGCSRRVQSHRTESHSDSTAVHERDSLARVITTMQEAYESLLQSSSGTEVEFACPCDTGRIGGAGMPHVVIKADGSKEFTGVSKFKDNSSVTQRETMLRQRLIDSMTAVHARDTTRVRTDIRIVDRKVRSTFIPWWLWLLLIAAGLLWLNERFRIFPIPLITRRVRP